MANSNFSQTQQADNPVTPCQQGNVFAAFCPQGGPALTAYVNGQAVTVPQMGPLTKNGLTLDQTIGALELQIGSQRRTIISDLAGFEINKPEEVGLALGMLDAEPVPTGNQLQGQGQLREYPQYNANQAESDDVYNLAIPPALISLAPEEGVIDIETADEETIRWLAVSIVTVLGRIDETTGARALANATNNDIDFTLLGTNAVPLAIELIDMLKNRDNRAFLHEIFKNGTKLSKVWTNASGNLMVSFRGYAGLRSFLNSPAYGVSNTKVSVISSAVRNSNQWAGTLRSVGGRIPIISYVIVGAIDVAEWMALPEAEQDLSDLLAILFVDISKIAISVIAGTAAAALVVSSVALAPIWLVVGVGVLVSVAVGVLLDVVDNAFGITDKVKDLANKVESSIEGFAEAMMEGVASVEEFMTHANPGDGKITGPTDYLMEIDTGIRKYIYDRLRWP